MPKNKKKSKFSRLKPYLFTAVALGLLAGIPLSVYLVWTYVDIAPPDISELELGEVDDSLVDNGFEYINKDYSSIDWGNKNPQRISMYFFLNEKFQVPTSFKYGEEFSIDLEEAKKLIELNQSHFEDVSKAISQQRIQPPITPIFEDGINYYIYTRGLIQLHDMKFWVQLSNKDYPGSLNTSIALIALGQKLKIATTAPGDFLIGMTLQSEGYKQLRWAAVLPEFPSDLIEKAIEYLDSVSTPPSTLAEDIKVDFQFRVKRCQEVRDLLAAGKKSEIDYLKNDQKPRFLYNETIDHFLKYYRVYLEIQKASNFREIPTYYSHRQSYYKNLGPFEFYLKNRNSLGRRILRHEASEVQYTIEEYFRNESFRNLTMLKLAASLYYREKKSLPRKLTELVPTYLDSLARDSLNGKEFGYSRDKKLVYSTYESGVIYYTEPEDEVEIDLNSYFEFEREDVDYVVSPKSPLESSMNSNLNDFSLSPAVYLEFQPVEGN